MKTPIPPTFKEQVAYAIKELKDLSTDHIAKKLAILEENLRQLARGDHKIISLPEHRKMKQMRRLIREVLRDRRGEVPPDEPIDPAKPRTRPKTRSGLKII